MKAILHHYPEQNNHILVWFQKTKLSKNIFQIKCFENIFFIDKCNNWLITLTQDRSNFQLPKHLCFRDTNS